MNISISDISSILSDIINDMTNFKKNTKDKLLKENKNFLLSNNFLNKINDTSELPLIFHILVKQQTTKSLCGFHALYNAKILLKYLSTENKMEKIYYSIKLTNDVSFWKFYYKCLRNLFEYELLDNIDREDLIKMGPMDPSHLYYLLEEKYKNLNLIDLKGNKMDIVSLFYGYGYFQNSLERTKAINNHILNFKDKKIGNFAILMGVCNHWITLVFSEQNIFLLDSNNLNYLDKNLEEQNKILDIHDKNRIYRGLKPYTNEMRNVVLNSFKDTKFILEAFIDCINGKYTLLHIFLNRQIYDFLLSFEKFVEKKKLEEYSFEIFFKKFDIYEFEIVEKEKEIDNNDYTLKIINWIKKEKSPRCLKDDILDVLIEIGEGYIFNKIKILFLNWISLIYQKIGIVLNNLHQDDNNTMSEFIDILKKIEIILNKNN